MSLYVTLHCIRCINSSSNCCKNSMGRGGGDGCSGGIRLCKADIPDLGGQQDITVHQLGKRWMMPGCWSHAASKIHMSIFTAYRCTEKKLRAPCKASLTSWQSRRKTLQGKQPSTSEKWSICAGCFKTDSKPSVKSRSRKGKSLTEQNKPIRCDW